MADVRNVYGEVRLNPQSSPWSWAGQHSRDRQMTPSSRMSIGSLYSHCNHVLRLFPSLVMRIIQVKWDKELLWLDGRAGQPPGQRHFGLGTWVHAANPWSETGQSSLPSIRPPWGPVRLFKIRHSVKTWVYPPNAHSRGRNYWAWAVYTK